MLRAMNTSVKAAKKAFNYERLRRQVLVKGFTQERLARETGVTLRAAQKWLAGEVLPSGESRLRIAEALGKDPEWFWEADAPPAPELGQAA